MMRKKTLKNDAALLILIITCISLVDTVEFFLCTRMTKHRDPNKKDAFPVRGEEVQLAKGNSGAPLYGHH